MSNSATRAGESEQPSAPAVVGHTPGHWYVGGLSGSAVYAEKQKLIASVYGDDPSCAVDERMVANACLIAEAPDLLEMVQELCDYIYAMKGKGHEWPTRIDALIARATTAAPAQVVHLPGATNPDEQKGPQ